MKLKTLLLALVVCGLGASCTQRTCPTYTQQDVEKQETNISEEAKAEKV